MEKTIKNETITKFTTYMVLFTLGLIFLHILIRPFFNTIQIPFLTERSLTIEKDNQQLKIEKLNFDGIPAIVYQYYDNNTKVNLSFVNTINENILNSYEFDYYLFNDKDARHFIVTNFDDELVNIYDNLSYKQKINLWLYCVLYRNGGVYININLKLKKELLEIIEDSKSQLIFTKQGESISNKFIVTRPGESIFKELIDSYYTDSRKSLSSLVFKKYSDNIKFIVDEKYTIKNIATDEICFEAIKY
jgi:mannosyltransferase OCH1-like enzyme